MLQKIVLLWGPPFCGAPVRLNMLNMPKFASENLMKSAVVVLS